MLFTGGFWPLFWNLQGEGVYAYTLPHVQLPFNSYTNRAKEDDDGSRTLQKCENFKFE